MKPKLAADLAAPEYRVYAYPPHANKAGPLIRPGKPTSSDRSLGKQFTALVNSGAGRALQGQLLPAGLTLSVTRCASGRDAQTLYGGSDEETMAGGNRNLGFTSCDQQYPSPPPRSTMCDHVVDYDRWRPCKPPYPLTLTSEPLKRLLCTTATGSPSGLAYRSANFDAPRSERRSRCSRNVVVDGLNQEGHGAQVLQRNAEKAFDGR